MPDPPCLTAAFEYLRLGWCPIPVRSGGDTENRKRPLIGWEPYQTRPPTEDEVWAWWRRWPDANVGLVTGAVSGMFALDLDGDADALLRAHGIALPETPTSETGGGGLHILLAHPGEAVPNGVKVLVAPASNGGKAPQGDVRGDGGYIVAPPSLHGSGRRYAWRIPPTVPVAPAPSALLALIRTRGQEAPPWAPPSDPSWVVAALRGPVPKGERNQTAARLGGHFLAKQRNNVDEVTALLTPWARTVCAPPMDADELRRTVASIARKERAKPEAAPEIPPEPREEAAPKASRAPLVRAATLKAPPVRYLVNPLLPRGMLTLLSAIDKMGKTLLSMEVARAVLDGTDLFGRFPVEGPGAVAAFWLDDPTSLTVERMKARALDAQARLWVAPVLDVDLSDPLATVRAMEKSAAEVGANLVIVDALYLLLPEGREAGNDAARMRPVMRELNLMAERTEAAVLLVAHDKKSGEDVAGSYVIRAACKMILRLLLPKGAEVDADEGPTTPLRVLRVQGKLAPAAAWSLEVQGDGWRLHGTQAEARAAATRQAVRAHLEVGQEGTAGGIAKAVGKRLEDVQAALEVGEAEGWAVGEKGKAKGRGRPPVIYRAPEFPSEAREGNSEPEVSAPVEVVGPTQFSSRPLGGEVREGNSAAPEEAPDAWGEV